MMADMQLPYNPFAKRKKSYPMNYMLYDIPENITSRIRPVFARGRDWGKGFSTRGNK